MKGVYYYNSHKNKWIWYISLYGEQVKSGICNNKKEMEELITKENMTNWMKIK